MPATIATIITDINAIFQTVSGISRVFTEAPDTAPSAAGDLPCVIPLVDRLDMTAAGFSYQQKNYTIRYLLLVTPSNRGLISAEKACRPFMDSVPDAFFAHVKVNDASVDHAELNYMEYKAVEYTPGSGIIYVGYEINFTATLKATLTQGN